MSEESGAPPSGRPASSQRSTDAELEYVSLEVDGKTYGGWYRSLRNGQMELMALASVHTEPRREATQSEQAQRMLANAVRTARKDERAIPERGRSGPTLGDLLCGGTTKKRVLEDDWIRLMQLIAAARDSLALLQLFERAGHIVFALMIRLVGDRQAAEALTIEAFHETWRCASDFDPSEGSVLAWVLNRARLKAVERLQTQAPASANLKRHGALIRTAFVTPSASEPAQAVEPVGTRPSQALRERLAAIIASGAAVVSEVPPRSPESEVTWEQVAPGLSCQLLAADLTRDRVSLLVHLEPGAEYPPHVHGGREELHLLDGELWIDNRKLHPGDYNRAEAGTADARVWSETGCTCVLIASTRDRFDPA